MQQTLWGSTARRALASYDLLSCLLRGVPIARAQALSRANVSFDGVATIRAVWVLAGSSELSVF